MSQIPLSSDEHHLWTRFIQDLSGIALDADKSYLIEERLGNLVKEAGCSTFFQLYALAKQPQSQALRNQIIDAISTHETFFFRDGFPFEAVQTEILPTILKVYRDNPERSGPLRIWSAGCSSGQELFSIAMILAELNGDVLNLGVEMLGTDISHSMIAKAQQGTFTKFEIERGLSEERKKRFFTKSGDDWRIADSILQKITFRQMNLLPSFSLPEKMDLILCRNVAIYFQPKDKQRVFTQMAGSLYDHGFLCIGATENLHDCSMLFRECKVGRTTFYHVPGSSIFRIQNLEGR